MTVHLVVNVVALWHEDIIGVSHRHCSSTIHPILHPDRFTVFRNLEAISRCPTSRRVQFIHVHSNPSPDSSTSLTYLNLDGRRRRGQLVL